MKCPQCSSDNVQVHYETEKQGFSGGKSCCGWLIFGPIGLLCGLCGKDNVKSEEKYWVCNNCGRKFTDSEGNISERTQEITEKNTELDNIFINAESQLSNNTNAKFFLQIKANIINTIKSNYSDDRLKHFIFLNTEEVYHPLLYRAILSNYVENLRTDTFDLSKDCVYFLYRKGLKSGFIFTSRGIYYDDKSFIPSKDIHNIFKCDNYLQINSVEPNIKLDFNVVCNNNEDWSVLESVLNELYINKIDENIEQL